MAIDPTDRPGDLVVADDATTGVSTARRPERRRGGASSSFDEPTGIRRIGRYVLLVVITFVVVFPIYTTVIASLKPGDEVLVNPLVPTAFTLDVLVDAWNEGRLGRYLFNSFVVATIVTAAQVVTSVLAAYAFAILEFPGKRVLFLLFVATLLVPLEATLVVNLETVDSLGWLNTYQGLAVPFLATAFGVFLLRQVFMTLPRDLRDAAAIDGVGHLGFLRHVAVPLVRPTIGALALFSFLGTWNQYLWPNLVVNEADMNTVQSGLRLLARSSLSEPNLVMAGTVIAAIPIFAALFLFQRQLVRGLTAGAVKG
jgi:sn-glycerol 3-phosphate transport system permease protein